MEAVDGGHAPRGDVRWAKQVALEQRMVVTSLTLLSGRRRSAYAGMALGRDGNRDRRERRTDAIGRRSIRPRERGTLPADWAS